MLTTTPRRRTRARASVLITLGLAASLTACGNEAKKADAPELTPLTSTSAKTGKPGATPALRTACIDTNHAIVSTNDKWNKAVDSRKDADLKSASQSMSSLVTTLRQKGKDSGNGTFKKKAETVASKVEVLRDAKTPSKTIDTSTYNGSVNDLTSYCTQMFPGATS